MNERLENARRCSTYFFNIPGECLVKSVRMSITAGLSSIKTAAEMLKMLRDGLKEGRIQPDEIAGRIGEMYDYIIDSKAALLEVQEELDQLKAEVKELKDKRSLGASLDFDGRVYWIAKGDKWEGPFCPICWHEKTNLVRLDHQRSQFQDPLDASFWCNIHRNDFRTRSRSNVIPPLPPTSPML
jgi:hypothetical protein